MATTRRIVHGVCVIGLAALLCVQGSHADVSFSSTFFAGKAPGSHPGQFCAGRGRSLRGLSKPRPVAASAEAPVAASAEAQEEGSESSTSLLAQAGLFLTYFGAQSGMSFYMKYVLSKVRVASDLIGVPASFLVTASQQLVAFTLFLLVIVGSRLIGKPYTPKVLSTRKEFLLVLGLSVSFSLNIGLNLLSLSLVPLSLTMIIRACSPLSTAFMQSAIMKKKQDISALEWALMSVGVFCASAVVLTKSGGLSGSASFAFFFGVAMSVTSLFSGALDFVFKGLLGSNVKLNALDTTCYMAIPVAIFTTIIGSIVAKPVPTTWAARYTPIMTDMAVFSKLWQVNPSVFGSVILSGVMAFGFNVFVTYLIQMLSPATAAFAGNFNKSATILVSLLVLEGSLAPGWRGFVTIGAVLGNIAAFTLYNIVKKKRRQSK